MADILNVPTTNHVDLSLSNDSKPVSTIAPKHVDTTLNNDYVVKPGTNFDRYNFQNIDRYKRFIDEIYPNVDLDKQAARNQTTAGKFGNMFVQGIVGEVLAQGIVGGIGSIIGLPQAIISEVRNGDADFSNFMTDFANKITNTLDESSPIFRYNLNKNFDWKDPGYWASSGVSIFSSLGMLIPALGEVKAVSYISKALKALSATAKIKGAATGLNLAADVFNTERYWQKLTHSAITMRNAENFRESNQAYNNVYSDALNQFKDEKKYQEVLGSKIGQEFLREGRTADKNELAKFIASKAAWKDYSVNAVNILFDAMQLAPLFKGFKIDTRIEQTLTSKAVKVAQAGTIGVEGAETVIKESFNASKYLKGAKVFLGEQVGEGVEELINAVAQNEGNYYGQALLGKMTDSGVSHKDENGNIIVDDKDWTRRLKGYLKDPASWEQAFWGFAGGVVFSGATRGYAKMQEVINDTEDPHNDTKRIGEIQNREIVIGNHARSIKLVLAGINPNAKDGKFNGNVEQIKKQKEDIIDGIKTSLGHSLGFEASKFGNVQYLLDMIEHPNFKDTFVKTGVTDDVNFAKDLTTLKQDILDAEHTYKTVYSKIFTDTVSKPWLREILISQANGIKADVKHTTKLRDKFRTIASNLRTNNPAFDSLKEKNKDNDFDGTLDNLVTAAAITALENNIDEYSDETSKKVITERIAGFKQELKDKHKEIGDKKAVGDFNVIADIIENEALAKINDVYLGVNNSLYEDVLNTKKSVPLLDKDVNDAIDSIHGSQFKNFNKKLLENTTITTEDTAETIDAKIGIVNDQLNMITTTKEDPYVETDKLTRKLPKKHLEGYINLLNNRKKYLEQQKIVATSRKETINELAERNKATEKSLQDILDKLKITSVKSKFTGHRDSKLFDNIRNSINSSKTNVYSTIYKLITDSEYKETIDSSPDAALFYEKLAIELGNQINKSVTANKMNEFINELLMNLSYVVTDYTPSVNSSTVEADAKAFKDSLNNNDEVKSAIDWTSENPINKDSVELANKWITGIVNSGDSVLFNEENPDGSPKTSGTTFFFEPIAAKYAKLTSVEKLAEDFERLKLAYLIASNNKVNPVTKTKRIYNTKEFINKTSAEGIISKYNLANEFSDPSFENEEYLKKTGGKDVTNTYIFNPEFKTSVDENGNLVVSDKDYDRLTLLLNGLAEGTSISVQVNSEYSVLQESYLNKNNPDMIPLVGTVEKDGKSINVLSINTIPTSHYGVAYNFKGKDWTDGILNDVGKTNLKSELISRIVPLLQNWYNLHKVKSTDTEFSTALENLLNADTFGIINEMLGKINPRTKEGHAALLHITKVIFFGNNTDGKSPITLRTQTIINNIRNWKSLLYRDHIGNTKLRGAIGTDVSKTITTNIKHITTGSLIHAKDKSGNKKYNKLTVINSKNKVKLFLVSREAKTVLRNTKDSNETIEKKSGEYSHSIFVGVETNRSNGTGQKIIPVPTINNKLSGSLLNHENDELYLEQTVKLIEQLGASRLARRNAREEKNDLRVEELGKEIDMLVATLKDVVRVDFKDEGNKQAIISNNIDIRFYNTDENGKSRYIVYNYYEDTFEYERSEGTTLISKGISRNDFKSFLGTLDKNVNYSKLGNKKYTDILGNKYNSYEEYIIESNSIVTDIGQVVDSKGNKISNFMPRGDNSFGVPLAINIDTSMLNTSINPRNNFAKFQNDFELDKRYSFIFEVFNQLLQSDPSIKFNGVVAETRKEGGRESYAWLDPTTRAINVSQHWVDNLYKKNKTDATLIIVHEILHALKESRTTEQQVELDKKLTEFRDTLFATPEYIALRDKSDKTEIEKKIVSILSMKGTHIDELLTYGLTDRDFARFLDSIQTTSPEGVTSTFWVKLKEIIRELASLFGVNTKLDEINSIFAQFISGQEEVVIAAKEERLLPGLDTLESPIFDDLESDENEIKHASFSSNILPVNSDEIKYVFKATDILQSDRAKQIFEKGNKVGWDLNKILTELAIPKDQKQLLLDLNIKDREQLIVELSSRYGFTTESKIAKEIKKYQAPIDDDNTYTEIVQPTQYYSNLTVPGGTNYTENEISTPTIIPSITGHAQFSTENGIGWFRSDEQLLPTIEGEDGGTGYDLSIKTNIRRILEIQSDLFQKGRNEKGLVIINPNTFSPETLSSEEKQEFYGTVDEYEKALKEWKDLNLDNSKYTRENQFLQLLNKDSNWVTFFVKTILQDSAKRGYKKVHFPTGDTAARVEGHQVITDEIIRINNAIDHPKNSSTIEPIMEGEKVIDTKIIYYSFGKQHGDGIVRNTEPEFIKALNEYKSELKTQGLEKLAPIEHFYTNTITNVLKKIGKITPITDEYNNTWNELDLEEVKSQVEPIKFSSYSSSINQEITNSPFELHEELNILNVLSQHAINVLDTKYKRVKLKDAPMDALRKDIIKRIATNVNIRRRNNTIAPYQLRLLEKLILNLNGDSKTNTPYNKDFWKLFRIHLANQYGYNVNETEDYRGDVEYLEKSWDQADVFNKNPMDTVNDRIKRLINTTFEVDPNDSTIVGENVIYNTNTNTPTGFADTLKYNERANKIRDLMSGSLSEQDMLDALLKYATTKNSIFAKTLFSIHDKLVADPTLMAAWFTSFDKPVVDSYRTWNRDITSPDGEQLTEITISLGNRQSARYLLANDWINVIVARGETGYYDAEWIKDWNEKYIVLHDITDNLTRLDEISAVKLSELFYLVGIEADINTLLSEFKKGSVWFKENIMKSLHYIKGTPTAKYNKLPYIEQLQEKPKWAFTEFSNLLKLADNFLYYREDRSNHSELNIKGNLVSDIRNPNFITTFFKKLNSDNKTIIDFLSPYTAAPQNQHSFLLWGDSTSSDRKGRGIFNYNIVDGKKQIDSETPLNKKNIEKLKFHGYAGTKNVSDNQSSEYHELNKHDWSLETFMLYLNTGETEGTENKIKVTGVLPLINPADRKSTMLFSTPIIPISVADASVLVGKNKDTNLAKETAIFKQLRNGVLDEMIAAITAKNLLFDVDSTGRVILDENNNPKVKDSILNNDSPSQLYYHYKLDKEGNKHYLEFKHNETTSRLELDQDNSGNVFGLKAMTVLDQNMQLTFNDVFVGDNNFILQLLHSPDLYTTLNTKLGVKESFTFNDTLDRFVHRFIEQQYKASLNILNDHKKRIEKSYLKKENINTEDKIFVLKDKDFRIAVLDFALNTYLFNIEQVRLFYGSIADYKSNNDLNKRGGQVLSNGIGTTLRGSFFGATISDIKLKSKVYRNIAETIYTINTGEILTDKLFNKFDKIYTDKQLEDNKMKFSEVEMDIYNTLSPYLTNDSANAVSLITFAEFEKRIAGFGLSAQYADVIDKVKRGVQLDREESTRFATMQKNFYYDLTYNAEMQKMVPIQVKNAEVVLTPELIKNLELSDVNDIMLDPNIGLSQLNLTSAEKEGSFYIATINDKNGKLLDIDEVKNQLTKAKREYKYENLRMQQEVTDALYEEEITLGRQIVKKMIENIPDDHKYMLNGKTITGKEVKDNLFALQVSNIHQDRDTTIRPFNVRINRKGHLVGDTSYEKVIEMLEKEAINRGLTKNIVYSIQKGDTGLSRLPIFFSTHANRWENILTSIFTNGINNQTFPGLHAPQMSSVFMNRKKGITQEQLSNTDGINYLKGRKDTKLRSTIIHDSEELKVIKAEVLLPRWASEFYNDGKPININDIPEEVRNMIGYRIPTEAKYSIYMFEVVGFLPDSNGPAIIFPDDFITQTGSDFDMDTVYALLYNIKRSIKTEIVNDVEVRTPIIETVKYLDDESEEALNKRVDIVMDDRKQLVHILSKALMNDELVAEINHLTTMIDQYTTISELNKELHKEEFARLDVVNQLIKESKGKDLDAISEKYELQAILNSDERGIYYKNQKDYLELRAKVKLILSKLSIDEQNTKKARQNKILDLYTSILSNILHYPESVAISNFKDITAVAKKVDRLTTIANTNINNFTFEGQQQYRDLSHQGRSLKGISIALDRFNSIAQVAGIKLSETLEGDSADNKYSTLPRIKYVIKNSLKSKLTEAYDKDIIFENIDDNTSYATVTHRFVGNNPGGTFIGVHGKQINSYSAQTTANILDNVAHRLPRNVGNYMINVWKFLPSIGSTFNAATLLVNQPILVDLVDFYERHTDTMFNGREVEEIKRKYQTLLYRLNKINGGEIVERWDTAINKGQNIFVLNNKYNYNKLGYENETIITLDEKELERNVNIASFSEINEILASATPDKARVKKLEDHIRYQLQVLETYKIYNKYSNTIRDTGAILNTDKIGAGPTFDTTFELLYNMQVLNDSKVLNIDGKSVISQVFPHRFGLEQKSVYPTIETFFEDSNVLSIKLFAEYFTGHSDLYNNIKRLLHDYIGDRKYNKDFAKTITSYFNNALLKDLPWFNDLTMEDKRNLLGIDKEPISKLDLTDPDSQNIFESLSVANQIRVYINQYGHTNDFLDSLSTSLQEVEIKRNKYHKISYKNVGNLDTHTQAFNDLWYSENLFERIIARNLVRYDYILNGFTFGLDSFSKVIPNTIFYYGAEPFMEGMDNEKGIGLSTHLYGKLQKLNNLEITTDEKLIQKEVNESSLAIFGSNYKERYLKSHWQTNNLVPDAGWIKRFDADAIDVEGNQGQNRRVFTPNPETGIISIPAITLTELATSKASNRIKSREIIKLQFKDKTQLYQRVNSFVNSDEKGNVSGNYYFYPINKLEYFENEEESVFPENNLLPNGSEIQSPDDYLGMIATQAKKDSVNSVIYPAVIAMNYTQTHGLFREELRGYNSTLDLVRAGFRTATTRYASTGEAEKWTGVKIGDYIRLEKTDEYIKVTKPLMHISLDSLPARQSWSEKEGWDITVSHKLEGRTDLFQFEYRYIGNKDSIVIDSNAEYDGEGELSEDIPIDLFSSFLGYKGGFENKGKGTPEGDGKDKAMREVADGFIGEFVRTNSSTYESARIIQRRETGDTSPLVLGELVLSETAGAKIVMLARNSEFKNKPLQLDTKKEILASHNEGSEFIVGDMPGVDSSFIDYLQEIGAKFTIYHSGKTSRILIDNNDNTSKFASYTSSVSPEINNAITTADNFIKTVYENLKVRSGIYKKSVTTKEVVEALNKLDIKEEIFTLELANLSTALIDVLNYMNKELLMPRKKEQAGIIARISEFENADMSELVNDPLKRKDFINSMRYTLAFLQGVTIFDLLESTSNSNLTEDEKLVNESIKALQNLTPTLKNVRSKFDRLLKDFSETNLRKYTKNPNILDGTRDIMDPGDDESYIQLQLDSLADTNNPFIALMVKQYSINMIKANDESLVEIGNLEGLLRKTFNKNITSLTDADFDRYLEYKNGKRTGKLIQKYDWDKFYADKSAYFKDIISKYTTESENYYRASKKWYMDNERAVISNEERDAIIAKKEIDLTASEFFKWKKDNLRNEGGKLAVKIGDSAFATPSDKYLNEAWNNIKDDALYQKFIEIINNYTDHFGKATILNKGFIPSMTVEQKESFNIAEKIQKWISVNKIHKESESYVGENNEMVYVLTVPMVSQFGQEKEIKIDYKKDGEDPVDYEQRILEDVRLAGKGNFKSLIELRVENKRIRKENDEYHAGHINYNLGEVFSKFIKEANIYKAKAEMKHEFDLALYQTKTAQFYKRDSKGKLIKDKFDTGEGTNLANHYAQWLEAIFYGNWDIDEGNITTISKMLLKFTSAKNMWLNLTAGINNVQFGKLQVRLEAVAGWYFKNKNLNKADMMYIRAIADIVSNLGSTKAGNLTNAIIKRLDITQNTNERDYTTGMLKEQFMKSSMFYVFNDMGEHYMQNVSALAMADHARIIDGEILSLTDYTFNNYKKALYQILDENEKTQLEAYLKDRFDKDEFKESKKDYLRDYLLALPIKKNIAFIEAKKTIDANSKIEFEKYAKLIDAFYLDTDGYAQLNTEIEIEGKKYNTTLNDKEFEKFKLKALKVVQKEQGIYNRDDAGMVQRRALGKLMIQFRKYMRPGWNKRFGSKFGKSFWTESRDEWDKGMYTSMWHFLKTGFKRNYDMNEAKEVHNMMGRIMKDFGHFATNINVYWGTLDDFEKGNIRRVMLEQLYLVATIVVAMMLKGLKPEDDDDPNMAYDLLVYEIDRLYSNTMMYNPIGLINEGQKILKSPAAVQGTVLDIYKLTSSLIGYPFQTDAERRYKTGVYAKELKVKVNAIKLTPMLNKYQQLMRINKSNKYYILFRG